MTLISKPHEEIDMTLPVHPRRHGCIQVDKRELANVEAIAASLDHVRRISSDVGFATLLCEIHQIPAAVVSVALDEFAAAGERALEMLSAAAGTLL